MGSLFCDYYVLLIFIRKRCKKIRTYCNSYKEGVVTTVEKEIKNIEAKVHG